MARLVVFAVEIRIIDLLYSKKLFRQLRQVSKILVNDFAFLSSLSCSCNVQGISCSELIRDSQVGVQIE